MGGEESKAQGRQQRPQQPPQHHPQNQSKQPVQPVSDSLANREYDGIEPIQPLVQRVLMKEQFPPDVKIDQGNLPVAHQAVTTYMQQISQTISQNEDRITAQTKRQLEEYVALDALLHRRQNDLDAKLAKMLAQFRQFDDEVKATTDLLKSTIERADAIAAQIDPSLNFKNFT